MMRPVEERTATTVVLWHGQYRADGVARRELWQDKRNDRLFFGLKNVRLEGDAGDWRLIADAYVDDPT